MSNSATFIEKRTKPDHRSIRDRIKTVICTKDGERCQHIFTPVGYSLIVTLLVAAGLVVYKATGLYDGVNSAIGHIVVGGGIIVYFILMFVHGLGRRRY